MACTKLHLDILPPLHCLPFPVAMDIFREKNGNQLSFSIALSTIIEVSRKSFIYSKEEHQEEM